MIAAAVKRELEKHASAKRAKVSAWFFKTEPGQYGYGDKFLGIKSGPQHQVAKQFRGLPLVEVSKLIKSQWHEERGVGLQILVLQFNQADEKARKKIYDFYFQHLKHVNNWDHVDSSAPNIVGQHLLDKPRKVLYRLAKSKDLWEKRISIIATYTFIRNNDFKDTLKIAEILLKDDHDLIHKAVGWMLREVGNRNLAIEEKFLKYYYKNMPRTMLRYAIEKFPEGKRQKYLKNKI